MDNDLRPQHDFPPTPPVAKTEMAAAVLAPSKRNCLIGKSALSLRYQVGVNTVMSLLPKQTDHFEGNGKRGWYPRHGRDRSQREMCDDAGGQSGSVEVGVLAGHGVGIPSHLACGAAADSGGRGEFVRCCTDATGTAGGVEYASTVIASAAACRV